MYKKLNDPITGNETHSIKRIADNACIPFDPSNTDYQAYLAWVAEGNTPEPSTEENK